MGANLSQNAVVISLFTRNGSCTSQIFTVTQESALSSLWPCYSHPSTDRPQSSDKKSKNHICGCELVLIPYHQQTAAGTWHHREEEPSPPSVLSLIWTITSFGASHDTYFRFYCEVSLLGLLLPLCSYCLLFFYKMHHCVCIWWVIEEQKKCVDWLAGGW